MHLPFLRRALPVLFITAIALGCQAPQVSVQAPPCDCSCLFRASSPQIGKGCYVNGDVLVCPLVRRTLDLEPAYPSEDPRCEKLPDGSMRCEVGAGETTP